MVSCATPAPRTCTFYSGCMEKKQSCGSTGYALGYGKFYCQNFKSQFEGVGGKLENWMWATLSCLQKEMVPELTNDDDATCKDLENFAFETHPKCYVDNGVQSICSLNVVLDWPRILDVIGIKGLWADGSGLKQMITTLDMCIQSGSATEVVV